MNRDMFFFFFFSSRRRHTRWNCDWSSDVCSSDLSGCTREHDRGEFESRVRCHEGVEIRPFAVCGQEAGHRATESTVVGEIERADDAREDAGGKALEAEPDVVHQVEAE